MEFVSRVCLLALAVVAGINAVSNASEVDFMQNLKRAGSFRCKVPQPRAIRSLDLLLDQMRLSEYIIPAMTVLYRCDQSSGCCLNGEHETCMPRKQENVTINFQLVDKANRYRFVTVSAVNHTECSCGLRSAFSPGMSGSSDSDV